MRTINDILKDIHKNGDMLSVRISDNDVRYMRYKSASNKGVLRCVRLYRGESEKLRKMIDKGCLYHPPQA